MAVEFLRKWLGQGPPPSPEVEEALAELARLGQERPTLAGHAALLADILPRLYRENDEGKPPPLALDHARAKLAGGLPLLRGETVHLDGRAFRQRWLHVCAAVERHQGGGTATALANHLRQGGLEPDELVRDVLAGRLQALHAQAEKLGLDSALLATVLRLTLVPALAPLDAALAPLRTGTAWERGYCPTCGSWPLLGEYRGLDQTRFLRCGLCLAEWEFPRLLCPFCSTRDHRLLGYFTVEGEEGKHRASTCDACRGYVRMVASLTRLSGPRLLVADLATLHLDLAVADRGYMVPLREVDSGL